MKIFNTQTRRKEELTAGQKDGVIRIYACGPTVYSYIHIGNARQAVVFDTLRRYLAYRGQKVKYVQNFTDIDDKMIRRAHEDGCTVPELAERFIGEYKKDAEGLGILPADVHPLATEHIKEIIGVIARLMKKGLAYVSKDGVYFDVKAFPGYGKLSGQDIESLEAGARIAVDEEKKNPMDFAVWKFEKPGEPAWDSPWGRGRPGWHIECSAMSMRYLGETIDLHGGGQDLIFPHHENEVAQSEGATGKPFSRMWMHNGYINVDNQKMSKSLGNFFNVRDVASQYGYNTVRFFLISAQYRSPLNFSRDQMEQAKASLLRMENAQDSWMHLAGNGADGEADPAVLEVLAKSEERFNEAMDDDLNTADAMGVLFDMIREVNILLADKPVRASARAALAELIRLGGDVLGFLKEKEETLPDEIAALVEARKEARAAKNWAESDRLRAEIQAAGYQVEDTRQGQKVTRA